MFNREDRVRVITNRIFEYAQKTNNQEMIEALSSCDEDKKIYVYASVLQRELDQLQKEHLSIQEEIRKVNNIDGMMRLMTRTGELQRKTIIYQELKSRSSMDDDIKWLMSLACMSYQ